MPGYPLVLTGLARVRCIVIGGGVVAERKVEGLLEGGAAPVVIAPTLTAGLAAWRDEGRIEHVPRIYQAGDLTGALLAVAATDDRTVNARVAAEAERLGMLVNVADAPAEGSFHTVATVRRGELLLTVSTGGASPRLAAAIRSELADRYGEEYARLLALIKPLREGPARGLPAERRAELWRRLTSDEALGWLRAGQDVQVEQLVRNYIQKDEAPATEDAGEA